MTANYIYVIQGTVVSNLNMHNMYYSKLRTYIKIPAFPNTGPIMGGKPEVTDQDMDMAGVSYVLSPSLPSLIFSHISTPNSDSSLFDHGQGKQVKGWKE